jgi:hypothetical protein
MPLHHILIVNINTAPPPFFASPGHASVPTAYPLPQNFLCAYSSTTFLPLFRHTSERSRTTTSLLRGFVEMFGSRLAGLLGLLSGNICVTSAVNQHHSCSRLHPRTSLAWDGIVIFGVRWILDGDGFDGQFLLDGEDWGSEIPLGESGGNVGVRAVHFFMER